MKQLLCLLSLLAAILIPFSAMAQDEVAESDSSDAVMLDDEGDIDLTEDESAGEVDDGSEVIEPVNVDPDDPLVKKSKLLKGFGYSFIGAGAILIGSGAGVYVHYKNDYDDKYDRNQQNITDVSPEDLRVAKLESEDKMTMGTALMALGGAVIVSGIVLVIVDAVVIKPKLSKSTAFELNFAPSFSPEFSGLSFSGRF